ncbi:MAG: hypothetical protein EOP48_15415 [Sphingobacteriales bacterium]|nr:MAG: hypothetical protein EOP48_15415 [Sphingobacteriales bacterium]
MVPVIIGISSGLLVILIFSFVKQIDKKIVYGLILTGIGFLYVGFTWSDTGAVVINCVQALIFLLVAAVGIKKDMNILAAGFFLHGIWDLGYHVLPGSNLIPPQYDLFCLSFDFEIGLYLLFIRYRYMKAVSTPFVGF